MPHKKTPEGKVSDAYRKTFSNMESAQVLHDLRSFAEDIVDPVVRCGRLDMLARIYMQCGKRVPDQTPSAYEEDNQ